MALPPLTIRIPDNYPAVPPDYVMEDSHNSMFLLNVEKYLGNQLTNMSLYSVTQLLHIWVIIDDGFMVCAIVFHHRSPVSVM